MAPVELKTGISEVLTSRRNESPTQLYQIDEVDIEDRAAIFAKLAHGMVLYEVIGGATVVLAFQSDAPGVGQRSDPRRPSPTTRSATIPEHRAG